MSNVKGTNSKRSKKKLSAAEREALLRTLQTRFEKNLSRHKGLEWETVQARLKEQPDKLWSLHEMERTGGEPDVVGQDKKTGEYIFYDCSAESPTAAEIFVTTAKRSRPGKWPNPETTRWTWPRT